MEIDDLIAHLDEMAASGAGLQRLLETAVEGLSRSDPRFDWTGVYELFSDNMLRLGPFVGAPTDHVFIGVGNGVCGTAVAERRNMNIPDVREITNYLACSVSTRSELVVLIRSGDVIHGQIDIDSHQVGAFDEASVARVERVADWLARAYDARGHGAS
ncbi:MAG TPA: GAF domain-containing protein [Candidatus Eisenbacteria bacterium]|jgi:GAF domain-containing protein|nr:GAF domain-containing protein [Candidatus Eisenbacteria bacterium]